MSGLTVLTSDGSLLTGCGLLVTLAGAAWSARGVLIDYTEAYDAAKTVFGGPPNPKLVQTLLFQSAQARQGLWLIFSGTALQILGLAQHAWQVIQATPA